MRVVATLALVLIAVVAALLSWGALSNLWADYQDSPTSTYLLVGIPPLLIALAAAVGAVRLWQRRAGR